MDYRNVFVFKKRRSGLVELHYDSSFVIQFSRRCPTGFCQLRQSLLSAHSVHERIFINGSREIWKTCYDFQNNSNFCVNNTALPTEVTTVAIDLFDGDHFERNGKMNFVHFIPFTLIVVTYPNSTFPDC